MAHSPRVRSAAPNGQRDGTRPSAALACTHAARTRFGWIHEMACPSENELYVGELLNWRLQKLTLHP